MIGSNKDNKIFSHLVLPSIKEEDWKNTDLSQLNEQQWFLFSDNNLDNLDNFKHLIDDQDITLVMVNGIFNQDLSNLKLLADKIVVGNLDKKFDTPDNFLGELNKDNFVGGLKIAVADQVELQPTIHILNIISGQDNNLVLPRYVIEIGQSAQVKILQTTVTDNDQICFINSVGSISLAANARLDYINRQMVNGRSYSVNLTKIYQKADSHLSALALDLGSKLTRNNIEIELREPGAEVNLNGLYALDNSQQVDNQSLVKHLAPHCLSNQLYKGVLEGSAKAVFKGKIVVDKIAQGTNAYQLNKNLLLGDKPQVYTKPQLEIFADDVKCTHGATIGQLNRDEMFYLTTRGLDKITATKMLTKGFVEDVLDKIVDQNLVNRLKLFLEGSINILK